jgi:antitoxin MazE
MQTMIQKWGNSLAVRIPKAFARQANLSSGTSVDLSIENGKIVLEARIEPEYRLDDLLRQVTDENIHAEVDSGPAVGREAF